jgi:flagellar basal body-associated protein FliL
MNVYEPTPKKKTSNWVKFGIPIAVLVIAGAVVGGIFGSRKAHSSSASSSSAASSAASVKSQLGEFPTATNSFYGVPLYPSTVSLPPSNPFYNASPYMSLL